MITGKNKVLSHGRKRKRKLECEDYAIIATPCFGSLIPGITIFHCPRTEGKVFAAILCIGLIALAIWVYNYLRNDD
jgi:hypothetical protein